VGAHEVWEATSAALNILETREKPGSEGFAHGCILIGLRQQHPEAGRRNSPSNIAASGPFLRVIAERHYGAEEVRSRHPHFATRLRVGRPRSRAAPAQGRRLGSGGVRDDGGIPFGGGMDC
jgi:hypothetical protein